MYNWDAEMQFCWNPFQKFNRLTLSLLSKVQGNLITIKYVSLELLLGFCIATFNPKQKFKYCSFYSFTEFEGCKHNHFEGVRLNDIPIVEDLLRTNFFLKKIDLVNGTVIGELARRTVQNYKFTVRPLSYNNHECNVMNFNAVFTAFFVFNGASSSTEQPIWSDI